MRTQESRKTAIFSIIHLRAFRRLALMLTFLIAAGGRADAQEASDPGLQKFPGLPDTLTIQTRLAEGFGPLQPGGGIVRALDPGNPWYPARPEVKGLPDGQDSITVLVETMSFVQHAWQSYKSGSLNSDFVRNAFNAWGQDTLNYSSEYLPIYVAIATWRDAGGNRYVKFASGLPLDFTGAEIHRVPEFEGTMTAENAVLYPMSYRLIYKGVEYDISTIFRIHDTGSLGGGQFRDGFISGIFTHRHAEFELNGTLRNLLVTNGFMNGAYTSQNVKFYLSGSEVPESTGTEDLLEIGQFAEIDGIRYRFDAVSIDGAEVRLIAERGTENLASTQVGYPAIPFSATTLGGKPIALSDYRGSYVMLDFWGTWCAPCIHELPYLKEAYRLFSEENFEIIGIANDEPETLTRFLEQEKLGWPQIVQHSEGDRSIEEAYNIAGWPTTFVLDPEGVIRRTNLRFFALESYLAREIGLTEGVKSRLLSGNAHLRLEIPDAQQVMVTCREFGFDSPIPLYEIGGVWQRSFSVEPGDYRFAVRADRKDLDELAGFASERDENGRVWFLVTVD